MELVAYVDYAHHQEAANAVRVLNEYAPKGLPVSVLVNTSLPSVSMTALSTQQGQAGPQQRHQPPTVSTTKILKQITLPSNLSASFAKTLAPNQPSTMMVSDTVLIKWDIVRPRLRLYYKDTRIARREIDVINRRAFFGRRLRAQFLNSSRNVVIVEGVSIPAEAAAAAIGKGVPGEEEGGGEGEKVKAMREEGEWPEEKMGEEVIEFRRRHCPDGQIRVFDDGYVHEEVMQFMRGFLQTEQERSKALEEVERTMIGWDEGVESAVNAAKADLKVGLKHFDIKECLSPPGSSSSSRLSSTPPSVAGSKQGSLAPCPQGSVTIHVRFHNSSAASAFYKSLRALVAPLPWKRDGRLITVLSSDLLYVMTVEKFDMLSSQIELLRTRLGAAQLRVHVITPSGHPGYRHVKITGGGHKRAFKPMIDALLIGEVIKQDASRATSSDASTSNGPSLGEKSTSDIDAINSKGAARGDLKPLWDAELDFLYGMQNIVESVRLPPETQILIDRTRRQLLVFGPSPIRRNLARERLLQKFEDVKGRLKVVTFDRYLLRYYTQAVERELKPKFGQTN
ncbi:hypothetical protein FRC17_007632, partial [Serendipita sp. 399]